MAISVDPATLIITIPQADLTFISGGLYELDVDWFRLALKDWEDDPDNMTMLITHNHNTELVLSGVTYARSFEIINGYTVTFEDLGPHYTVRCVGANHNLADVLNFNVVNLIIGNSAGLITVTSGSGVTNQDKLDIADEVRVELATELGRMDAAVSSRLAAADYTAPPAVSAFWQYVVEAGLTAEEMLRLMASVSVANATGLNGTDITFSDLANTKARVVGSVVDGVRTITTRDGV